MRLDPSLYFRATLLIAAAGSCLADLELLSLSNSLLYGILAYGSRIFPHSTTSRIRKSFKQDLSQFRGRFTLITIMVRLAAAIWIVLSVARGPASLTGLSLFVICDLLLKLRGGLGNNGSDEMFTLIMVTSFLARLCNTPLCTSIALLFLAAQLSLAYLTSGMVKIFELPWRNGTSMVALMSTEAFGQRWLLTRMRSSAVGSALISTIFVFGELLGSLAPWLPPHYAASLLGCALMFHLAAAVVMGLNTFVPAFAATYPAVLYTSHLIYGRRI